MSKFKLFFLTTLSAITSLFCLKSTVAKADSYYSNVLDDFLNSQVFDDSQFPYEQAVSDYSNATISLIDLKENQRNELIIYVYNPTGIAIATHVNISQTIQDPKFISYELTCVSSSDKNVLQKYRVNGLMANSNIEIRNYLISSIFRKGFNIPGELLPDNNGQTSYEIAYSVGKLYQVTRDGYISKEQKIIEITEKFIGNILYDETSVNIFVGTTHQNINFVSFNTNMAMDDLYEVELNYDTYDYTVLYKLPIFESGYFDENTEKYSNKTEVRNRVITSEDEDSYWISKNHKMKRIAKTSDLLDSKSEYYDKEFSKYKKKNELSKFAWTLFFFEADYEKNIIYNEMDGQIFRINTTVARDITFLRLKFISDGIVFDLGVVDDISSGNVHPLTADSQNILLALLILIIIACMIITLFPQILNAILSILKSLIKLIIKTIKAPFKLIKRLFTSHGKKNRKY